MDQIQKCSMIQENQHVDQTVNLHVTVVNMLKYGTMYLWNISKAKMENIQEKALSHCAKTKMNNETAPHSPQHTSS